MERLISWRMRGSTNRMERRNLGSCWRHYRSLISDEKRKSRAKREFRLIRPAWSNTVKTDEAKHPRCVFGVRVWKIHRRFRSCRSLWKMALYQSTVQVLASPIRSQECFILASRQATSTNYMSPWCSQPAHLLQNQPPLHCSHSLTFCRLGSDIFALLCCLIDDCFHFLSPACLPVCQPVAEHLFHLLNKPPKVSFLSRCICTSFLLSLWKTWRASCFFSPSVCARLTASHVTALSGSSSDSWQSKRANKCIHKKICWNTHFEKVLTHKSHSYHPFQEFCSAAIPRSFCFVPWKLIFHPLFVFLIFPKVPTSLSLFVQLQFIKHSWRCRNVLFHYCAINHFSRSFSPAACRHPCPPLPIQLVLFDSCYLGKWQ